MAPVGHDDRTALREGANSVEAALWAALGSVVDPELGENVVELDMVRSVVVADRTARIELALTIASCPLRGQLSGDVERHALAVEGVDAVVVRTTVMEPAQRAALMSRARAAAQRRAPVTEVPATARVLALVSGKGGVGKSSITVNLAASLARSGHVVGVLDADIWGHSIPRLLGIEGELSTRHGKMLPLERPTGSGLLKVVSMGFLADEDEAIMWRGLVLNRAVQHFLEDVAWGAIDYLLVDMPPGTGDVQMGLARMLPRAEMLVVTTPPLAAATVAGRAASMARKGHVRVAGVIENLSGFSCAHGEHYDLFGAGGGERLAAALGVPLLGSVPIDAEMASRGDAGAPIALGSTGPTAAAFHRLAERIASEIAPIIEMSSCSARLLEQIEAAIQ